MDGLTPARKVLLTGGSARPRNAMGLRQHGATLRTANPITINPVLFADTYGLVRAMIRAFTMTARSETMRGKGVTAMAVRQD